MRRRWIAAACIGGFVMATTGTLSAQQRQPAPAFEPDPNLDAADQLAPSQVRQPMPAAVATPTGGGGGVRAATRATDAAAEPGPEAKPSRLASPHVVVCSGVFARDSSHLKLTTAFRAKNVAFAQVDGGAAGPVMASVLFAKDPGQRLEVWWAKPASRSDIHLIVINGRSDWSAPGDLRLGLTLADLERLNGKPFKLSGFDRNNVATLTNWDGGALAEVPGGCKVGISLRPAAATPASALGALPADREFSSADSALRAANPTVSEILIAY